MNVRLVNLFSHDNRQWKITCALCIVTIDRDELWKIFETQRHREIRQRKYSEESESSEEEDNNDEKLEEKEGWKLLRKAIESKCLRAQFKYYNL
ncbi:hypothetical protein AWC38_SpisGene16514 [Stylophora pistillata]|uniref:Uncharacterized protein n=1 Tax=Stylophora pistillata TaxID=50429 RepID=A0A2B4RKZ5_STYPI|nr:hypothetical protein AWC38_SpisGene16514 [Stylophora pistillata]